MQQIEAVNRSSENPSDADFAVAMRDAVERVQASSGADIVALYPYDEDTENFYAPVMVGVVEDDVVQSLPDLADQLRRYRADKAAGKTSDELTPSSYGPSAWLIATRRPLISADAATDIDGSFVRRHKIRSMLGLPLLVGNRIVGLLYLDYAAGQSVDVTDTGFLQSMEAMASELALTLDSSRHREETAILRAVSALVGEFSTLPAGMEVGSSVAQQMEAALDRVLAAARVSAAALYVSEPGTPRLTLLACRGASALALHAATVTVPSAGSLETDRTVIAALAQDGLHPIAALPSRVQGQENVLLVADKDPLILQRHLPVECTLLQTAADLLGTMLNTEHLIDALGETSRTLGAVTRLGNRLLQPHATQEQALRTAVAALIDPTLPELDFEFANVFLIESTPNGRLAVHQSTGVTTSPNVHAVTDSSSGESIRVPAWAGPGYRVLDKQDVVAYVATRRRAVVVAALDAPESEPFVGGYPDDLLALKQVPILRNDGSVGGYVRAARLREAADRAPISGDSSGAGTYEITEDFTLNGDLYSAFGHTSLVRVFVPFGSDVAGRHATGVLEAGFHISREHRLQRVQIEALRACAATVAVAVETAKMYEDVTRRARQLEIINEISRAIATSIDLDQTLSLIARNMTRAIDTSICLIALLDEDGSAWYGAAASDMEDHWRQRRVERPETSIVFEVADKGRPLVVEDAQNHELVSSYMARLLGLRSLVALPLLTSDGALGAVILGERDRHRLFTSEEVEQVSGLTGQAAMAIRNARVHAREEEEHHIQKDVILIGFGQWGQKAYKHLVLLKNFFNFRIHVVEADLPGRREVLADAEGTVIANGDLFYWGSPDAPAHDALAQELEPSCYVITYIATPAQTHLPMLKVFYDLSNVVLIEKPLGAPPEEYRAFLERTDGSVQIVAADHYWFKLEVRLLELLLTEERNLRAFLDEIEEVEIEIMEEQSPTGSGAQIGMIADLLPHAFAVLSLLTPLDRLQLAPNRPLQLGRYQPLMSEHETYARLVGFFDHKGRDVRVVIDVGKGVANGKWIKLSGERRMGGRRPFYKFDLAKGVAIDGTQSALRAATRPIRQPGVPDNAHLSMLRHVIEKKNPAVGILSIREAIRANARIQQLEKMANEMLTNGDWTPYEQGQRPPFPMDGTIKFTGGSEVAPPVQTAVTT